MSKLSKNLLLALSLVCAILLIIFCVELIIINRGVDPGEQSPVVSGQPPEENEDPDPEDEDPPDDPGVNGDTNGTGTDDPGTQTPRPPPQGTRHELQISATDDVKLIIYAKDELFDFSENELDWLITYTGGGNASLEIGFEFISTQAIADVVETFLNNYTGSSNSTGSGEEFIKGSSVRGYHVSASVESGFYEAWIHNLQNSDFALVFVLFYQDDQQKDALYEVLGTMDIITV